MGAGEQAGRESKKATGEGRRGLELGPGAGMGERWRKFLVGLVERAVCGEQRNARGAG